MKVYSYARDMSLNRKCVKQYVEIQHVFENKVVIFSFSNVLYLFGLFNWLNSPPVFLFIICLP